jgi:hypothetical protein
MKNGSALPPAAARNDARLRNKPPVIKLISIMGNKGYGY